MAIDSASGALAALELADDPLEFAQRRLEAHQLDVVGSSGGIGHGSSFDGPRC